MPDSPIISVVIATFNRKHLLAGCLDSLANQVSASGLFELIVVNDGSTDDTASYLDTFSATVAFPVKVCHQANSGVAAARNQGIALASGDVIAFTDDDCLLRADWIASLVRLWQLAADDVGGIGGLLDTVCDTDSLLADYLRFIDEFNHLPVITPLAVRPRHISRCDGTEQVAYLRTSNASFRVAALRKVGSFNEAFRRPGGEDPDLSYRILAAGYRLVCSAELRVMHRSRPDYKAYFESLANYVNGEFVNRTNRHYYPDGPIRRSYTMIPFQKIVSLALAVLWVPPLVATVLRNRRRLDLAAIMFPLIFVASKCLALWIALRAQLQLMVRQCVK